SSSSMSVTARLRWEIASSRLATPRRAHRRWTRGRMPREQSITRSRPGWVAASCATTRAASVRLAVASAERMGRLGALIAEHLDAGDLVALNGELGAGKTTLVRGIGGALGARGSIASPTFVLARTHPTESGVPLVHVDAYRLGSAAELDDLDLDFEGSIVAVEWAAGMLDGVT